MNGRINAIEAALLQGFVADGTTAESIEAMEDERYFAALEEILRTMSPEHVQAISEEQERQTRGEMGQARRLLYEVKHRAAARAVERLDYITPNGKWVPSSYRKGLSLSRRIQWENDRSGGIVRPLAMPPPVGAVYLAGARNLDELEECSACRYMLPVHCTWLYESHRDRVGPAGPCERCGNHMISLTVIGQHVFSNGRSMPGYADENFGACGYRSYFDACPLCGGKVVNSSIERRLSDREKKRATRTQTAISVSAGAVGREET